MLVKDILSPSNVMIENQRFDKASLLRELCNRAAPVVELPPQTLFAEVMRREELGSTGLGQGIAIPHTRLADLKKPYSFMVRLLHPIDFDAVDGEPVDIIFFLCYPHRRPRRILTALLALLAVCAIRQFNRSFAKRPTAPRCIAQLSELPVRARSGYQRQEPMTASS